MEYTGRQEGITMSDKKKIKVDGGAGQLGFVFFLCYIGAVVYFVDKADGFWEVIFGFIQAIVWPAFLVYHAMQGMGV